MQRTTHQEVSNTICLMGIKWKEGSAVDTALNATQHSGEFLICEFLLSNNIVQMRLS